MHAQPLQVARELDSRVVVSLPEGTRCAQLGSGVVLSSGHLRMPVEKVVRTGQREMGWITCDAFLHQIREEPGEEGPRLSPGAEELVERVPRGSD